jgi:alpha-tubulin suppressor-like RCC1 family protein
MMKKLFLFLALLTAIGLISSSAYAQHRIGVTGSNEYGQLGNGTASPTFVSDEIVYVGTDTNWVNVACGFHHNLAIKSNRSLWGWGRNHKGQLGNGSTTDVYEPTQIGTDKHWKEIDGGEAFSMAIKTDGSLWGWGDNSMGQLGDGTTVDKLTPTRIGTSNDWAKIKCGANYVLAIKTDSSLWAWGDNSESLLGDGTTTNRSTPTLIHSGKWIEIET